MLRYIAVLALAGRQIDWTVVTIGIVLVGVPSVVVLVFVVRRALRIRRSGGNPLLAETILAINVPSSEAMGLFRMVLPEVRASLVSIDEDQHHLLAKQGMTRRSWGQWLDVEFVDVSPDGSSWHCKSWPTYSGTVSDRGAGRLLLDSFQQAIRARQDLEIGDPSPSTRPRRT
jgi:hypothetical protein